MRRMRRMKRRNRERREGGAALAEYGLIVAGVTMVSLVAVSIFGSKVAGLIGTSATLLPSADTGQNAPVQIGQLIETRTEDANNDGINEIVMDVTGINHDGGGMVGSEPATPRLGQSMQMDPHDAAHLIQLGSKENLFH